MKRDVAERVNLLMIQHNAEVNSLLWLIKNKGCCGEAEYVAYRRAVGNVMGSNFDIMNAIYEEHPELKPEGLGGPLKTDELRFALAEELRSLAGDE
jgi:hypothetical protein